jgi:hypothetical protein
VLHECEIMTPCPGSPRHGSANLVPPDMFSLIAAPAG